MGRPVGAPTDRRSHPRLPAGAARSHVSAKLRTGSPVLVVNISPDGMLVDTPARLLPGHHVDLVLQGESSQEVRRCCVVHSRIAAIDLTTGPRYRAGLRLSVGNVYPGSDSTHRFGKMLPVHSDPANADTGEIERDGRRSGSGTQLGNRDFL